MHSQLLEQVNDLLMPAERVVYPAKPHSMMLLFPSVFFALAYGCFRANSLVHDVGYLFIVIALVLSVLALVSYQTTQVLITNQRVFIASGFIKREARGFFLDAIQHFELRQPAWAAAITVPAWSHSSTGRQSAVITTQGRPGSRVQAASATTGALTVSAATA